MASSEDMVSLLDEQLIVFYILTLKLKEAIGANLCIPQANPIARPIPLGLYKYNSAFKPLLRSQPLPLPPPPPPPPLPRIISKFQEKISQARRDEASSHWVTQSIYRVPKSLRDVDQTAYTPKIVSIGPYHRGRRPFRTMDRHKWRSLYHALDRTGHDVSLYLDAARLLEDRARSCYEAPISLSSDDFVETLVLDSIFTLELFLGFAHGFQGLNYSPNDPVFAVRGIMHLLQRDMIMLENQLPLFVLDWILAVQEGCEPSSSYRVAPLALLFFNPLMPIEEILRPMVTANPPDDRRALHCLDLFRHSLLPLRTLLTPASGPRPSFPSEQSAPPVEIASPTLFSASRWLPIAQKRRRQLIHCVADLRDASIKFWRRTDVQFWDIKFEEGVLYIPRIFIHDGTKSLFLNLMAFEQCNFKCRNHITAYLTFMNNLINSEVDVGHLHDNEIIENLLGSDREVAHMFNRLCKEVVSDINDCYLSELSEQVNLYYNKKWNTWRASFNQKYFSNPWTFISLMAAIALLLLTALQTFYTVYPYYKKN
ncbi:UPF0481 protein At3g47200-like [Dendrobium catenatum]|uniref:UPF0481 protein n=1 Tax=Dendrobium catenatum TaxID=906689 RepID=A0A2I0WCL4_9ASPA|nr:UPF0481 protein At3g47200-like [Dendrobium catenatum]PKU73411.1 UPF0481 protein [Dendrobium catenatum]